MSHTALRDLIIDLHSFQMNTILASSEMFYPREAYEAVPTETLVFPSKPFLPLP